MVTLRSGSMDMDDAVRSRGGVVGMGGGGRRGVGVMMGGGGGPGGGGPMLVGGIGPGGGVVGLMGGPADVDLMSLAALNQTRPPSTTSVSSSTGSGAPRMATTSRRGGRTRARSPVVSGGGGGGRMSANNNTVNGPDAVAVGTAATQQQQQQQQQQVVVVSDNPSSAAAAAAAAAKAFANNGGDNNNNNNNNMNSNNSMMSHMNMINNNNNNAPGGRGGGQWPPTHQDHGDIRFRNNNNNPSSSSSSNGGYGPPSSSLSSRKWPGDDVRGGGGPTMHHGGGGMSSIMGSGGGGPHHPPNMHGGGGGGRYGGYDGYPGDRQHGGGGPGPYGNDGRGGGGGGDRRYRDLRPSTYDADMRGPLPLGGLRGGGPQRYPPPGADPYGYPHPSNREPPQQQRHLQQQQQQQQQQSHSVRSSPSPKNSHRGSPVGSRNNGGNNNNNSNSSISSGGGGAGGTTMVIGGTKPIHVPKTDPLPTPASRASGIFRRGGGGSTDGGDSKNSKSRGGGRGSPGSSSNRGATTPTKSAGAAGNGNNNGRSSVLDNDDDSPQKILLSLRTPTSSFEEKKESDGGGGGPKTTGLTLSPDQDAPLMSPTQQRAVELFERTPEQHRNIAPIDNNPSFVLFNSSFDSFGGDYFNVEASLQTDSFGGMVRTASTIADNEATTQILQSSLSNGNISTAQMLAPSASGHLTIGYSPVNSFGNVSSSAAAAVPLRTGSHGGGNTLLLGGGPEVLSPTAPPQVLGIYRSYSGAGPNGPRPLDDSHLRMSVGSFGAQSMSYGVSGGGGGGGGGRPFGDNNTITVSTNHNSTSCSGPYNSSNNGSYYGLGPIRSLDDAGDRMPGFYVFLRKYKTAFKDCSFLLPGLKAALLETPKDTGAPEPHYRSNPIYGDPTPHDLSVSRRRVQCSVCAFGGNHNRERPNQTPDEKGSSATTIFRGQQGMQSSQESATVTPSSSTGSPPRASFTSRQRMKYEEELPGRYYENESRLSWEFEDNPPVEVSRDEDSASGKSGHGGFGSSSSKDDKDKSGEFCRPLGDDASGKRLNSSSPQQPKMRYRCKLCGQPKQNHTCPYQQSLARSIGIMVYPAVNAFTAAEPGSIAPPLSEMNNFVDLKDLNSVSETSPGRPTPERMRPSSTAPLPSAKQVTPESARSSPRLTAPSTPPGRPQNRRHVHDRRNGSSRSGKKRSHNSMNGTDDQGDLLFVEPMELLAQQFLTVTTSKALSSPDAYSYPALPLPYAQRKRLSDNLFSLSNEVPKLTDECAQVLREAREKDMWDLAVAELMTQVIVVIHCRDGDHRFEGLRQYLLTLGIAC